VPRKVEQIFDYLFIDTSQIKMMSERGNAIVMHVCVLLKSARCAVAAPLVVQLSFLAHLKGQCQNF